VLNPPTGSGEYRSPVFTNLKGDQQACGSPKIFIYATRWSYIASTPGGRARGRSPKGSIDLELSPQERPLRGYSVPVENDHATREEGEPDGAVGVGKRGAVRAIAIARSGWSRAFYSVM